MIFCLFFYILRYIGFFSAFVSVIVKTVPSYVLRYGVSVRPYYFCNTFL